MREKLIAGFLFVTMFCMGLAAGRMNRARAATLAQSNALNMSLTFGGRIVPTINVNQAALVPQCSKMANCRTQIMLCNRASGSGYGEVQGGGGGCVILNGGDSSHTILDLSINDVTQAGTAAPTSVNFPVGSIDFSSFPDAETNSVP